MPAKELSAILYLFKVLSLPGFFLKVGRNKKNLNVNQTKLYVPFFMLQTLHTYNTVQYILGPGDSTKPLKSFGEFLSGLRNRICIGSEFKQVSGFESGFVFRFRIQILLQEGKITQKIEKN
jgi:hypothetical protein